MATKDDTGCFAGKVAFVTGAANGIGRATALAFSREGARVVVADVSETKNHDTARMIQELGGHARAWSMGSGFDILTQVLSGTPSPGIFAFIKQLTTPLAATAFR